MYEVAWAAFAHSPPKFLRDGVKRGRRRQGVLYEQAAQSHFERNYGEAWLASPWIVYRCPGSEQLRWCQPDALLFDVRRGKLTIVEFKYQHTSSAWEQLRHRYDGVVRRIFPSEMWDFAYCEVVKWYDVAVAFPEPVHLVAKLEDAQVGKISVHIWKP